MNCRIFCSDDVLDYELDSVIELSDFVNGLFKDSCRCTATVHLSGFCSDAVRLAIDLVRQAREMGEGVVVEEVMVEVVEPVYTALGIACTRASENSNNNPELDAATSPFSSSAKPVAASS